MHMHMHMRMHTHRHMHMPTRTRMHMHTHMHMHVHIVRTRVRVRFAYRIHRAGDDETLAHGFTVHACLRRDGTPQRLPAELMRALDMSDPSASSAAAGHD